MFGKAKRMMGSFLAVVMTFSTFTPMTPAKVYADELSSISGKEQTTELGAAFNYLGEDNNTPTSISLMSLTRDSGCTCVISIDALDNKEIDLGTQDFYLISYSDKVTDANSLISVDDIGVIWDENCPVHATMDELSDEEKIDTIKDELYISSIETEGAYDLFTTVSVGDVVTLQGLKEDAWYSGVDNISLKIGIGFESILNGVGSSVATATQRYDFERDKTDFEIEATYNDTFGKDTIELSITHPTLKQAKISTNNSLLSDLITGVVELPYNATIEVPDKTDPVIENHVSIRENDSGNLEVGFTMSDKSGLGNTYYRIQAESILDDSISTSKLFNTGSAYCGVKVSTYINGVLVDEDRGVNLDGYGLETPIQITLPDSVGVTLDEVKSVRVVVEDFGEGHTEEVVVIDGSECTCHYVLINNPVDMNKNIGYATGIDMNIATYPGGENYPINANYLDYTWESTCPMHTSEPDENDVKAELLVSNLTVDRTNLTATLTGNNLRIDGLSNDKTTGYVSMKATLGDGYMATPIDFTIELNVTRALGTPEIKVAEIRGDKLYLEIAPNGNSEAKLFMGGVQVELDTVSKNIEFTETANGYVTNAKIEIAGFDTAVPVINSAHAHRNEDKTVQLEFSFNDVKNIKDIQVTGVESNTGATATLDLTKTLGDSDEINSYLEYRIVHTDGTKSDWVRTSINNTKTNTSISGVELFEDVEIRAIDLSGNTSTSSVLDVEELPCTCTIEVLETRSVSTNIGSNDSGEIILNTYMTDISTNTSPIKSVQRIPDATCPIHSGVAPTVETTGYAITGFTSVVSIAEGTGQLAESDGTHVLGVEGLESEYVDVVLAAKLGKSDIEEYDVEFTLRIERTRQAPGISKFTYDAVRERATITGVPNGNSRANLYVDRVFVKQVSFDSKRVGGGWFGWGGTKVYVDTDFTFDLEDNTAPLEPQNITLVRDSRNGRNSILSWDLGTDADHFVPVQLVSEGKESNEFMVNAKSAETTKEIKIYDIDGNELSSMTTKNSSISIPVINLYYGGHITIKSIDDNGNESGIMTYQIPNEVVYNTVVNDDYFTLDEGSMGYVDAKLNDVHDISYDTPTLESVTIITGSGEATVIDSTQLTDKPDTMIGLVVAIVSQDAVTDPIEVRYTYTQVRDDIPAASGTIHVTIKPRNQEPIINADNADVTQSINAESNTTFYVPYSMILANDTDREIDENAPGYENAKLSVYSVRNCNAGTATMEDDKGRVRIDLIEGFYGYLTFEYRITDGEALSINWAKVTVYVKNSVLPPVAKQVNTVMEASALEHSITLNVENPSAVPYTLDSPLTIYFEGEAIDTHFIEAVASTVYDNEMGMEKPFIKLVVHDDRGFNFQVDDVLTIPYTVRNQKGASSSTVYVTITVGDDPYDMEGYLYVHRRPLAIFNMAIQNDATGTMITGISLGRGNEKSYDLDHQAQHAQWRAEKPYTLSGIRTWEWGVKTLDGNWITQQFDASDYSDAGYRDDNGNAVGVSGVEESARAARAAGIAWINEQANNVISANPGQSVVIALRVRDVDGPDDIGEWSEQRSMLLASIPMKPVAQFTLDKSTYIVPSDGDFTVLVTDLSYDSNGDDIISWKWELTDPSGRVLYAPTYSGVNGFDAAGFNTTVSKQIRDVVNSSTYNPKDPSFKLSLIVGDNGSPERLESDKYSVSFLVYKDNAAPIVTNKPGFQLGTIASSTLYEEDDGIDGLVGDNWGTASNTTKRGTIDFKNLLNITDDQATTNIKIDWMFDGQKVMKRTQFIDGKDSDVTKMYRNLKYNAFVAPFTHTVTDEGFKPGAYKLTVAVSDAPSGNAYMPGASKTVYWNTYSNKVPYHIYVVPKLDMYMHNEVNGWIDQLYRMEGNTRIEYTDDGLEMEDIAPTIGDTIKIYGSTNQYVTSMYIFNDLDNDGVVDLGEDKLPMTMTKQNLDTTKEWEVYYPLNDVAEAPEGSDLVVLNIKIAAQTIWGGENGEVTRTKTKYMPMQALPVKLYDFRVTSVTDPAVYDDFKGHLDKLKTLGFTLPSGGLLDGVPVGKLAVDRTSTAANADGSLSDQTDSISKGYSFYFKVSSKGMAKDEDEIRIIPRFYEAVFDNRGETTSIGNELAGYLPDADGIYRIYTSEMPDTVTVKEEFEKMYELFYEGSMIHSLGSHYDVRIKTNLRSEDGNSQTWSGRYGIPADAKFFRYGSTPSIANEYKGDILITFDITAYKNGKPRYNYVERGQWAKERAVIPDALKAIYGAKESSWKASDIFNGAIITFDATRSMVDNYISNPVWRE